MLLNKSIKKRDGTVAAFDDRKIFEALFRAFKATGEGTEKDADFVTQKVCTEISNSETQNSAPEQDITILFTTMPEVEQVQDIVEAQLILAGFVKTAKAYILYRQKRFEARQTLGNIPTHVRELVQNSKQYFQNSLAEFVYYRTYARWIETESRRETWIEAVKRYMSFMQENLGSKLTTDEYTEIEQAILRQEAMPSMRLLQFAGTAARATNIAAYNCSFIAPSEFQDFAEILYILMCGTGVGFSVERQNVSQFPTIKPQASELLETYIVPDSKEGWADALAFGIKTWFNGQDVSFDLSQLRPAGARLKTMGGKSAGPEPLKNLLNFTRDTILKRQGEKITALDVHDIICKIGECVVAGGVRRSALISLSDIDDLEMRDAKQGQFYRNHSQRSLANNSAVYTEKPSVSLFLEEWLSLIRSGSGERGIFNRWATNKNLPTRRLAKNKLNSAWGTNPCGEIILRSKQFCNLSEVVARETDTVDILMRKTRIATILGTYQATLTNFPYLSQDWAKNCQEERLLGVSITGQWDCPVVRNAQVLQQLRNESIRVNREYAARLNTVESTCITCVKPSGTLSQLVNCASGMHPRYAPYYIRRVRISATDSLFKMLRDQGVPYHPEVGQELKNATTFVLEFPVKAPDHAIFKNDLTALDQLEHWKLAKLNFTEHNPSVTVSISDHEWLDVANWIYKNWDTVGGLSFLPRFEHVYELAPYEEIAEAQYYELLKRVQHIDFSKIVTYEHENETDLKRELACVGTNCEI